MLNIQRSAIRCLSEYYKGMLYHMEDSVLSVKEKHLHCITKRILY